MYEKKHIIYKVIEIYNRNVTPMKNYEIFNRFFKNQFLVMWIIFTSVLPGIEEMSIETVGTHYFCYQENFQRNRKKK